MLDRIVYREGEDEEEEEVEKKRERKSKTWLLMNLGV